MTMAVNQDPAPRQRPFVSAEQVPPAPAKALPMLVRAALDGAQVLYKKLKPKAKSGDGGSRGVCIVGGYYDERAGRLLYLKHTGPEHVLVFAPTRSGKGVGLILPTLASCRDSVVVSDLKGENWLMTSGYRRALGQRVLMFNPTAKPIELNEHGQQIGPIDPDTGRMLVTPAVGSVRFNPLDEIRLGTPDEVRDAQNIANIMMSPPGSEKADPHWRNSAIDFFQGMVLHVMYAPDIPDSERNLGGIYKFASNLALMVDSDPGGDPTAAAFKALAEAQHAKPGDDYPWMHQRAADGSELIVYTHPVVRGMAGRMMGKPAKERGSVISTVFANMALFADPTVCYNTAVSEFCVRDLMHGEQAVSLYLVIPPSDMSRIAPLLRLLLTQLISRLTESIDNQPTHKLLMLLDEFPAFGKLDAVLDSIAFTAGYGIRYYLIVQSITQLKSKYGDSADDIVSNCHIRVAYSPNEMGTAELLSKLCGTTTVHAENVSTSKDNPAALLGKSFSESMQASSRPLLTPDECLRLPKPEKNANGDITVPGAMLIFVSGASPIMGRQSLWFQDPVWRSRVYAFDRPQKSGIPHPIMSDVIRAPNRQTDGAASTDLSRQDVATAAQAPVPAQGAAMGASVAVAAGSAAVAMPAPVPETVAAVTVPAPLARLADLPVLDVAVLEQLPAAADPLGLTGGAELPVAQDAIDAAPAPDALGSLLDAALTATRQHKEPPPAPDESEGVGEDDWAKMF